MIKPYLETSPKIASSCFVADTAEIIGDVKIGGESSIWCNCVLRGDVNNIVIGDRTNIQDGTVIHVAALGQGTYIGDDVTVGHMALLHACTIEAESFIGMKACVMDGAHIQKHAMVAAGALVTPGKVVPSGELWAGSPARKMRDLTEDEILKIKISASHYCKVAENHKTSAK